jgi:hypothetical protein
MRWLVFIESIEHLRQTLRDANALEREKQDDRPIEEVVGKINPRESDAKQALCRALRMVGHKNNTEKSYVPQFQVRQESIRATP